jgi:4'-phosphopantetheinyl transferase
LSGREALWYSAGEHEFETERGWLTELETERAGSMRFTKRRNDYLLGRYTSKRAVAAALGLPGGNASLRRIEVKNRMSGPERGVPELRLDGRPGPFDLSITDRAGWGVCVLTAPGVRVGCDLELVEPRSVGFVADYLTPSERHFVTTAPNAEEHAARANLLWSAKESVLKVLRTGLRRDTRSVEVRASETPGADGWCDFEARSSEGRSFTGWWRRFGSFLLTVAFEAPVPPPRALVDPPGLAAAMPSHRWLEAPVCETGARSLQ